MVKGEPLEKRTNKQSGGKDLAEHYEKGDQDQASELIKDIGCPQVEIVSSVRR